MCKQLALSLIGFATRNQYRKEIIGIITFKIIALWILWVFFIPHHPSKVPLDIISNRSVL